MSFADAFPVVDKGLFLDGPPGVGKTHLAVAVLRQVIRSQGARGSSTTRATCCASSAAPTIRSSRTTETRRAAPGDEGRPARARRSRRREDLGVGRGDAEPDRQHALQRAAPDDLHVELRGHAGRHRPETRCCSRIGFRMRSRLHEMCEFLDARRRRLPRSCRPTAAKTICWRCGSCGRRSGRRATSRHGRARPRDARRAVAAGGRGRNQGWPRRRAPGT